MKASPLFCLNLECSAIEQTEQCNIKYFRTHKSLFLLVFLPIRDKSPNYGLLKASFIPSAPQRELRELTRYIKEGRREIC